MAVPLLLAGSGLAMAHEKNPCEANPCGKEWKGDYKETGKNPCAKNPCDMKKMGKKHKAKKGMKNPCAQKDEGMKNPCGPK